MITGFGFIVKDKNGTETYYDYISCLYPYGVIDTNSYFTFMHFEIEKIISYGYIEDNKELMKCTGEYLNDLIENGNINKIFTGE